MNSALVISGGALEAAGYGIASWRLLVAGRELAGWRLPRLGRKPMVFHGSASGSLTFSGRADAAIVRGAPEPDVELSQPGS